MARRARRTRDSVRRREDAGAVIPQIPFQEVRNPYPPMEIISADQVEDIHNASLLVLEDMGINFLLEEARDMWKAAGADVKPNDPRVRFDRGLIEELIQHAPSEFTLTARNPAHNVTIGGNRIVFGAVSSPPNAIDIDGGRRSGNFKDYCDFLRLVQSVNVCHMMGGYPVEPTDIDPKIRHLEALRAAAFLTDKITFGYSLGRRRIIDAITIAQIAAGISDDELWEKPCITTVVNANSPLQYDVSMLIGMIEMSNRGLPVIVTPFTLAGAMAPVTVAGALVQQNAEALAGIAFCQLVKKGARVMYGGFTSNVDMKSGAPAFGTPEYSQAVIIGGQLARRYNIPYRSSNVNASNAPDAQAAWEAGNSLWACILGHCNFAKHSLGWMEGGLSASFEKFIIDAEMIQMMIAFLKPLDTSEDAFGLDAIKDVGPGGHYFGTAHTLARYETAFNPPILADWSNFENWTDNGSQDAATRANVIYKKLLAAHENPPMDAAVKEELNAFVDRRIAEGGAGLED